MKHHWNIHQSSSSMKLLWNTLKTTSKHPSIFLLTFLKHPCNFSETPFIQQLIIPDSAQKLECRHIFYTFSTLFLHFFYTSSTLFLHFFYIFSTLFLHIFFIFSTHFLHIFYIFFTHFLHIFSTFSTFSTFSKFSTFSTFAKLSTSPSWAEWLYFKLIQPPPPEKFISLL